MITEKRLPINAYHYRVFVRVFNQYDSDVLVKKETDVELISPV